MLISAETSMSKTWLAGRNIFLPTGTLDLDNASQVHLSTKYFNFSFGLSLYAARRQN